MDAHEPPNASAEAEPRDPFTEAKGAFLALRGLTFTVEWRRFPWTRGTALDRALVGPAYLGNVALGLKQATHWAYQSRDGGTWRYVPRTQVWRLVNEVCDEFAGFVPPLPPLPRRQGQGPTG